ncbi:hypothetical protein FFLO_00085 [Filobasidium floriforme]|uniref:HMG box domain-containing protein n=1 Tax=Filobasidium floriforme TaxID=5210 RepID=A0A8K0JWZ9_9TREE|nr:hypothetical protein FFLO_00085 [Filobasidium floriforme]
MPPKAKPAGPVNPTWEEMEEKRKEMVASLQALSEAMKTCAHILEDYVSHSPENILDTHEKKRKADEDAEGAGKGKRAKKEKKIKDPNEPKRPPSAYLAYQNAVREEVKKSQPDISYNALIGMIGEKWKAMTDEEKKPYQDRYEELAGEWKAKQRVYTDVSALRQAADKAAAAKPLETASTVAGSDSSDSDDSESEKTDNDDDDDSDDSEADSNDEIAVPAPAPPPAPAAPAAKKGKKDTAAATPAAAPSTPSKAAPVKEKKTKEKKAKASPEKAKKPKSKKTA